MFIKDLSASADLDAASMTAVSGGQADPQPGPPVTPQDGPPPVGNGSGPIGQPPSHNYPASKYNPYHYYYQQPVFPTLMP
jgi:hypothetical protein